MKKISLFLFMIVAIGFVSAQTSLSKNNSQQQINEVKEIYNPNKQTIMLIVTEIKDSEKISLKTYGTIDFENVKINTTEDKIKLVSGMDSIKKLSEISTFDQLFQLISASSFNVESHQVLTTEKGVKHYFILSL
jgi:hypothetical protein